LFPAKTVPELIDYTKSNPGKVTMASIRHRHRLASRRRAAQADGRHQHGACPLSRRRAARLADLGTVPMPLNAQEFAAFIAAESEKWGKVVRLANIAPQ
jgi:hypothetical protein